MKKETIAYRVAVADYNAAVVFADLADADRAAAACRVADCADRIAAVYADAARADPNNTAASAVSHAAAFSATAYRAAAEGGRVAILLAALKSIASVSPSYDSASTQARKALDKYMSSNGV